MKVAYVVGGLPFGGIENLLFKTVLELGGTNWKPVVINLSGTGVRHKDFEDAGIEIYSVNSNKKKIKTFSLPTFFRLRKLLKEINPDIVHTMHFSGDYYGRLASVGLKSRVITHIRNIRAEKKLYRRIANKLLSYKTDLYLSVSQSVHESVQKNHNTAGRDNAILYDVAGDAQAEAPLDQDIKSFADGGRVVVGVGRLVETKNFEMLVQAFALLAGGQPELRLLIVGEGKRRKNLEALAESLKVQDRVFLAGYRENVASILKTCHIFAFPSLSEGFGIAHLEAVSAGLPSVVCENIPSLEVAGDCTLVCKNSPEDMAAKMELLLNDEKLYKDMAEKARLIAGEFTLQRYVKRLTDIYDGLLDNKHE